jgi:hypothetical protein
MSKMKKTETPTLQDYISEYEAKKLFKRSTTWFWELRKKGFPFFKLGGENYYRLSDFVNYMEKNRGGKKFQGQ